MLMQDFSGGLNKRVAPSLLNINEAQVLTNVETSSGSIKPVKGLSVSQGTISKYFTWYYAAKEWVSKSVETSFVEYRDKLYYTVEDAEARVYDGTNDYNLGISRPVDELIVTAPVQCSFDTELTTGGDLPAGEYNYKILVYSRDEFGDKDTLIAQDIGLEAIIEEGEEPVATQTSSWWDSIFKVVSLSSTVEEPNAITIKLDYGFPGTTIREVYREYEGEYKLVGSISSVVIYLIDDVLDISANDLYPSDVDNLGGTYTYTYTYYDSVTGIESQPNDISEEIMTYTYANIEGLLASADAQVDTIRLYRVGGALSNYTLVEDLDNIDQTYIDNNADIDIAGNHILDSYSYSTAPKGLKYITQTYAMLFGALDDKLYYSDIALPYAWPATNFIDFADTITGIGPVQNGIIVFTKFETYIVTGNSPDTFTKYLIDSSQGCESHYSISFVSNTLVWLSQDGLCTSSGGDITIITANSLGKLALTGVNNSQVFDKVYYLSHENGILCYDFRYNTLVRTMDTTIDWLGSYKDGLWASVDGQLKTMLEGEALTYTYKSPMLTEGMYSNLKVYKDFYIKYNGDVTLNLYVDKALVNTKVLTGDTCYNLKALASAHGYGLEIELIGTAEVSEIQFIAEGRQNGR